VAGQSETDGSQSVTNYAKSMRELVSLRFVLGCEGDVWVTERPRSRLPS